MPGHEPKPPFSQAQGQKEQPPQQESTADPSPNRLFGVRETLNPNDELKQTVDRKLAPFLENDSLLIGRLDKPNRVFSGIPQLSSAVRDVFLSPGSQSVLHAVDAIDHARKAVTPTEAPLNVVLAAATSTNTVIGILNETRANLALQGKAPSSDVFNTQHIALVSLLFHRKVEDIPAAQLPEISYIAAVLGAKTTTIAKEAKKNESILSEHNLQPANLETISQSINFFGSLVRQRQLAYEYLKLLPGSDTEPAVTSWTKRRTLQQRTVRIVASAPSNRRWQPHRVP